jgi:PEP-CTERM motif
MRRFTCFTIAVLACAQSHAASVSYHLVTAQPPGVGLYAQVVFNDPPASATSAWSAALPSVYLPGNPVASLSVFNIPDIPGIIPLPIYERTASAYSSAEGTVGSPTGATLVGSGNALMFTFIPDGHLQAFQLTFNPDGTGRVTVSYLTGRDTTNFLVMDGTWVLGDAPQPVPEPGTLLMAAFPVFFGFVHAWHRRRRRAA